MTWKFDTKGIWDSSSV